MLNENIKNLRKARGLSQEELAIKLNVVRQTVSKWERGESVPDAAMLIALAEELDTSVGALLGEAAQPPLSDEPSLQSVAQKLEVINLQLAKQRAAKIKTVRLILVLLCVALVALYIAFAVIDGEYLNWNFSDPETAVAATLLHGFEFVFARVAPLAFIASAIGIMLTYKFDR